MNDPRTEKARLIGVEQLGPRQFKVGRHYVDLNESDPCHCGDSIWRNRICKHIRAALNYEDQMKTSDYKSSNESVD
jgi:hypothetical protein